MEKGQNFDLVLTHYAIERLLYRLAQSRHAGRFVLKGAMLLMTWFDEAFRGTRDLDLLAYGDTVAEQWRLRIDEVDFTIAVGEAIGDLDPEVSTLFTTWDLEERQSHSDTHVELQFVVGNDGMMFGHMALTHLLNWTLPQGTPIDWRHAIRRNAVVSNMTNFRRALERALEQKVVRTILHQQPHSWPDFMSH